jgi:hypothetical protein
MNHFSSIMIAIPTRLWFCPSAKSAIDSDLTQVAQALPSPDVMPSSLVSFLPWLLGHLTLVIPLRAQWLFLWAQWLCHFLRYSSASLGSFDIGRFGAQALACVLLSVFVCSTVMDSQINQSTNQSFYPFIHLCTCPSVHICLSIHLIFLSSVYLIQPSVHSSNLDINIHLYLPSIQSVHILPYLSTCLSIYLSIYCLSIIYQSIYLSYPSIHSFI